MIAERPSRAGMRSGASGRHQRRSAMADKAFASTGDVGEDGLVHRDRRSLRLHGRRTLVPGIIVGDDGCMVIDAQRLPPWRRR